jgi:hypothetical protein
LYKLEELYLSFNQINKGENSELIEKLKNALKKFGC